MNADAAKKAALLANPSRSAASKRVAIPLVAAALLATLWWQFDGTAEYLAFRAARSASAENAERDYAVITSEHPRSRQRENAWLRLAQFQIARGAQEDGLKALDSLGKEFPDGATQAERSYWKAKALIAKGDSAGGCAATATVGTDAAARLGSDFTILTGECAAFRSRVSTTPPDSTRPVQP